MTGMPGRHSYLVSFTLHASHAFNRGFFCSSEPRLPRPAALPGVASDAEGVSYGDAEEEGMALDALGSAGMLCLQLARCSGKFSVESVRLNARAPQNGTSQALEVSGPLYNRIGSFPVTVRKGT